MAGYLRDRDGRFAGSVSGQTPPQPVAGQRPGTRAGGTPVSADASGSSVESAYERFVSRAADVSAGTVTLTDFNGAAQDVPCGDLAAAEWFLVGGNCHSLAAALHEATGFPLVAFYDSEDVVYDGDEDDADCVKHYGVLSPDGFVLDGFGAQHLAQVEAGSQWTHVLVPDGVAGIVAGIEFETAHRGRVWQALDRELVSSFVVPVLEKYEQARQA